MGRDTLILEIRIRGFGIVEHLKKLDLLNVPFEEFLVLSERDVSKDVLC